MAALDGLNVVYYMELSEAEQRRMKVRIDSRRSPLHAATRRG
jgi:hypothetical protein